MRTSLSIISPPTRSSKSHCGQFLRQIENQEIQAFTSTHVAAEAAHRLLTLSVVGGQGCPTAQAKPNELAKLVRFRTAIERVVQSRIVVLSASSALLVTAAAICQQPGLLITDALTVALMQAHGLNKLASDDTDFDRVPCIIRYAPA